MTFNYSLGARAWLLAGCLLAGALAAGCRRAADAVIGGAPLQPAAGVVPVRVARTAAGSYALLRAGRPYLIKGAAGVQHFDLIRAAGGNSVRIYTAQYADVLLDAAQGQGLTVMLGLWMKPPYEKFDYYDPQAVAAQQREVYRQVQRYKNHPALLMWNLGNELDNHARDFKVYQIVNETARMIHQLDPNHPITTTLTDGVDFLPAIAHLCPEIDVLTVNAFNTLAVLPDRLARAGWTGPYVVGEFGCQGWWEVPETGWGAPLDQSGSAKAEFMARGYRAAVAGQCGRCLGAYALYWGNRFEQTGMWLSMFAPGGEKTPMVDMIQRLWSGRGPANRAPDVGTVRLGGRLDLDNVALAPGAEAAAAVSAVDPDGDALRARWAVTRDVDEFHVLPQNRTAPEAIAGAVRAGPGLTALVRAPAQRGAYRLLVDVYDGQGSVTSDSFPFFVGTPDQPSKGVHMPENGHPHGPAKSPPKN